MNFAGTTRIAVRTGGTLSYLLGDHLGSSSVTTNASGVKTASALYKAFGETRYSSGALGTDYKFTGQREQAEFGLYFYGARWYDGSLGRFTSPDTMIPSKQGVQAWDRYAYVNNNPVRYTDPTGHGAEPPPNWWNPFAWNTLSGGIILNLKAFVGISVAVMGHANYGVFKDAISQGSVEPLKEFDMSVNLEITVSTGGSEETTVEGILQGSNETVRDQAGLSIIKPLSSIPINVGACATIACGKIAADVDFENNTVNSFAYQLGGGQGFDVSADLFSLSIPFIYGNPFLPGDIESDADYFWEEFVEDLDEYGE